MIDLKPTKDPDHGKLREVRIKPAKGGFLVHADRHGIYDEEPSVHKTLDEAHAEVKRHFSKRSSKR